MFARNTPRRPHPFGWIDLLGRRWSVKVTKISSHTLHYSSRLLPLLLCTETAKRRSTTLSEADNAFWEEILPGVNVQSMHLYDKRFASLHITRHAACGVAFLTDQCFSAKTPGALLEHYWHMQIHADSTAGSVFSATDRSSYTLQHTIEHTAFITIMRPVGHHTGCSDTVHVNAEEL